jgi:hypothetical protein
MQHVAVPNVATDDSTANAPRHKKYPAFSR